MATAHTTGVPFGRMLTAMVTPFTPDGALDVDGAQRLARHLIDAGNDGLVISGTTGESPVTSDEEKDRLLRAVLEAVGDEAHIVAGAGTNDTEHTLRLAQTAERVGAHGLLVVSPYYNKPPQAGLLAHFRAVADSSGLPIMMYDIPGRTGVAIETETLLRLAEHERIVAVKDAKADLFAGSQVIAESDLVYYSGDDPLNLAWLSVGAVGFVSVVGHVIAADLAAMIQAYTSGEVTKALEIHQRTLPAVRGIMKRTQGCIASKAALRMLGLPGGPVRLPYVDADPDTVAAIRADLALAGIHLGESNA